MKEELELISEIYKRINISELAPRDVIKGHLRDARRMLNDLTVKLSQHDVIKNEVAVCLITDEQQKCSYRSEGKCLYKNACAHKQTVL